jgi:hypothetical protein
VARQCSCGKYGYEVAKGARIALFGRKTMPGSAGEEGDYWKLDVGVFKEREERQGLNKYMES